MSKEEDAYEPLPEGTRPLLLNMKQMEKWDLKTGPRLIDVVPYKWIPVEDIQADLQFAGALSPWSSVKSEINVSATQSCHETVVMPAGRTCTRLTVGLCRAMKASRYFYLLIPK